MVSAARCGLHSLCPTQYWVTWFCRILKLVFPSRRRLLAVCVSCSWRYSVVWCIKIVRRFLCLWILCLWFRASLMYVNNCPTRCNTKQSVYYSAGSLSMFRVSTAPIISSTQNCNYSLTFILCSMTSTGGCGYSFVYWWWVWLTPETCRVNLQNNK